LVLLPNAGVFWSAGSWGWCFHHSFLFGIQVLLGRIQPVNRADIEGQYCSRLETRTKESIMYASLKVINWKAQRKQKGYILNYLHLVQFPLEGVESEHI